MASIGFIVLIGAAAVAFMLYFLVAMCKDGPREKCHLVHILPAIEEREVWDSSQEASGGSAHQVITGRAIAS